MDLVPCLGSFRSLLAAPQSLNPAARNVRVNASSPRKVCLTSASLTRGEQKINKRMRKGVRCRVSGVRAESDTRHLTPFV
jgi:hypothetical protein